MGLDFVRFKRNLLTVHMFYCLLCNNNLTCYHNELLLTTGPKCNRHSHLKSNCLKVMYTYIFVVKSIFLSWNQIPGFIFRVSECRHNAFIREWIRKIVRDYALSVSEWISFLVRDYELSVSEWIRKLEVDYALSV